jgi:Lon protease-like protein
MPSSPIIVPIFPLPLVACPGEQVPLHVFESRYREMISACRRHCENGGGGRFGIFLEREDRTCAVGCLVRISRILHEHHDGQVDLVATGMHRVRILERLKQHAYDTAQVEPVCDESPDWDDGLATRAYTLHACLIRLVTGMEPAESLYSGRPRLSFVLAQSAGLPLPEKQALLELCCEDDRLRRLVRHLQALIGQIETVQRTAHAVRTGWDMQQAFGASAPTA